MPTNLDPVLPMLDGRPLTKDYRDRLAYTAKKAEHASRVQDWPTYRHWLNGHTLAEKRWIEDEIKRIRGH